MEDEGEQRPSARRRRRTLGALLLVFALALLGLWLDRKPIATGYADRWLAAAKVPARYTIAHLGLGRQRLTDVVLGDPAHPDLVADWLETRTAWGLRGPYLAGVRGGHVRVRARWVDGRLSLGSIDRLLPPPSGKPFALPALDVAMDDARVRVETPWGPVGASLRGRGRLDGGFDGRLAMRGERLGGGCAATRPAAVLRVTTTTGRVRLRGPVDATSAVCGGVRATGGKVALDATIGLGQHLTWTARAAATADAIVHPAGQAGQVSGTLVARGQPGDLSGTLSLDAAQVAAAGVRARDVGLTGKWLANDGFQLGTPNAAAHLSATSVRLPDALLRRMTALPAATAGTPVAPLAGQLAAALVRGGRDAAVEADLTALAKGGLGVTLLGGAMRTARGAEIVLSPGADLSWSAGVVKSLRGTVTTRGDGLPTATLRLARARGGPVRGTLTLAPYAAPGAALTATPIAFDNADGWRVRARATLSGPLGDGQVEALTLPIDARWRAGVLTLGNGCAPVSWAGIAASGLRLDPGGVRLCPIGGALVSVANGRLDGGASLAATRLTGRLGSTPLTLAASGARLRLADRGFAIEGVEARLGSPERVTRLSIASLRGRAKAAGLAGRFAGAGGQIGAVPLLLSEAAGDWRLAGGALTLDGALRVADTAAPARFQPMAARDVTLRLADGEIAAAGALHEPTTGTKVADVAIRHALGPGSGSADLTVAGLTFAKRFQPELLTRITFGVIADVRGTVGGEGHIAWSPAGVTSTGAFRTAGTDLAAAFGPVAGLAGEVRFTDLLALESAPGQRVTIRSINPGIPVTDGVVTFRTLPGTRVQVEDARWPFAGGSLVLEPTLLDFAAAAQRRMTFRVTGAAADQFLQQFDFKNLDATGTFDGVLPMVFDAVGGRIVDGRLTVRPGGGTLAYVGPISQKDVGFWPNLAFQALKSLRYRSLGITMNGPLAGEMVTEVRFAGVSQGEGAKSNFLIRRLQRLPFVFNIRIRAPFRGLLDSAASFYDPKRLIQRNLPQLLERQQRPIQPSASETVP